MPELNLDLLNKKKKTTTQYRPYDTVFSTNEEKNNKVDKSLIIDKIKEENSLEISILKNELILKYEKEFKAKEDELKKKYEKKEKKDLFETIIPSVSNNTTFKIDNEEISTKSLLIILKKLNKWEVPTINLFLFFIEKTNFGRIENVQIGRREIELKAINGKYVKEAREFLCQNGLLIFKDGYIEGTKKIATFYTLNIKSMEEYLKK